MGAQVTLTRRDTLGGLGAFGGVSALGWAMPALGQTGTPAGIERVPATTSTLAVSSSRSTALTTWTPYRVRGVLLLSHGHGSWPDRYGLIADLLGGFGYAVMAPLHVDSVRHPDRAKFTMQASFGERIADMSAAVAEAARVFPDQPIGIVGHSFGTLTALCLAGGLQRLGAFRQAAVRSVVGFSSPGNIPGLVTADAYASVDVPTMIVTGTADTIPGFVTDPADHLLAAKTANGAPRYAYVVGSGGHELIADFPAMGRVQTPLALFLAATVRGDAPARERLATYRVDAPDQFLVEAR